MDTVTWTTFTTLLLLWTFVHNATGGEYCWQTFNATCTGDDVILMATSLYGRMKLGKCLKRDYYVGCQADVLPFMDRLCSGRQYCELAVPDNTLQNMVTCPDDIIAYLDATYTCVKVASYRERYCVKGEPLRIVNSSVGYLASSVTEKYGLGTADCPWQIRVRKGQQINVTLFDFHGLTSGRQGDRCQVYAIIREPKTAADVTVCGGDKRQKSVYVSESEVIYIQVIGLSSSPEPETSDAARFLLRYEAIGCPAITAPSKGWVRHEGIRAIIACNETGEVRHLVCNGTAWVGDISPCSQSKKAQTADFGDDTDVFPVGLLVAIIIGIMLGIVLGVIMLTLVMHCLKKRQRNKTSRAGKIFLTTTSQPSVSCPQIDKGPGEVVRTSEYGYAHVWELQHLKSNPDVTSDAKEKVAIIEHVTPHECPLYRQSTFTLAEPKCQGHPGHTIHAGPQPHTCERATLRRARDSRCGIEDTTLYHEFDPELETR